MIDFQPFSPVEIRFAIKGDAIKLFEQWCKCPGNTLLLASDSLIKTLGIEDWVKEELKNCSMVHVDFVPPNPTVEDVFNTLYSIRDYTITNIIAIGGGSCIDLAKAISALHCLVPAQHFSEEWVLQAIKEKQYLRNESFLDILAVPTTSGTGSEVTKWATIWNMKEKTKLSVDCVQNYPKMAIIVPEFTVSLPKRITLSTGLDALSHAMEAFWAKSHTPLSQSLAICAIQHVEKYLPMVLEDGTNLKAREGMCLASLIAGLSFSITRTTACHSISYPLTMLYGIEHGFAAALSLLPIARRNRVAVPEISLIYDIFGGEKEFEAWMENLCASEVQLKLDYFGIGPQELDVITEKTFTQGRMDNNPIVFSEEQVKEILNEML